MEEGAQQNNAKRLDDFRQGRFLLSNDQDIQGTRVKQKDSNVAAHLQSSNSPRSTRQSSISRNDRPKLNASSESVTQKGKFSPDKQREFQQQGTHDQHTAQPMRSENQPPRVSQSANESGFNNETMRRQRLEEARSKSNENSNVSNNQQNASNEKPKIPLGFAKNIGSAASSKQLTGMAKQIHILSDMPYVFAIGAAILKDFLDLGFIGSFPVIGSVVTICVSIFIFFMLLLSGGSSKKGAAKGMLKKLPILGGGTIVEMFFGINFFPVETATVGLIYLMDLRERSQQVSEKEKESEEA